MCNDIDILIYDVITRINAYNNVKDVIFNCSKESKEVAGRVATMIWILRYNRNQWIWNQEKSNGTQLGVQAFHMWDDWYKAQQFNQNIPNEVQQKQQRWIPPRQGWFKCNVDASFHNSGRITGGGWCIRDEAGQFVRVGTHWRRGELSVPELEAMALLEAMRIAYDMNMNNIVFETDAQMVTGAVHTRHVGVSLFSSLISNIKNLLTVKPNFEVKFVKHQVNLVAHS